jgi:hypothetical protein
MLLDVGVMERIMWSGLSENTTRGWGNVIHKQQGISWKAELQLANNVYQRPR